MIFIYLTIYSTIAVFTIVYLKIGFDSLNQWISGLIGLTVGISVCIAAFLTDFYLTRRRPGI